MQLPQAFASQQAPGQDGSGLEPDDITVVKVQQSLADPDIERVQVRQFVLSMGPYGKGWKVCTHTRLYFSLPKLQRCGRFTCVWRSAFSGSCCFTKLLQQLRYCLDIETVI